MTTPFDLFQKAFTGEPRRDDRETEGARPDFQVRRPDGAGTADPSRSIASKFRKGGR